jgi:transcriptional regulator with XRE-family HTH domain
MAKRSAADRKPSTPDEAFGRALRNLRRQRGFSQDELAHRAGYHRTYVGMLERAVNSPSLKTIFNLCSVLEISPSRLLHEAEVLLGRK